MTGWTVHRHASLGSTSDEIKALAAAGAPAGTVVVASVQTAGRGQQGRYWASPAGNLYASFLLRDDLPALRASEPGFVAALAVCDVVDALLPASVARLKWPNDVLLGGSKLAGILGEMPEPGVLVIGIGCNVGAAPDGLPYPATSLAAAGAAADVEAVLLVLLRHFARRLAQWRAEGFAPIRADWLARGPAVGEALSVRSGATRLEGTFAGLDAAGALLLAMPEGVRRIVAGELLARQGGPGAPPLDPAGAAGPSGGQGGEAPWPSLLGFGTVR